MCTDKSAQRRDKCGQRRIDHVALGEIDDPVRSGLAVTQHGGFVRAHGVQRCAAARVRRREVFGQQFADCDILPLRRIHYPVAHEVRQHDLVSVLKLTPAASPEVAAGRRDVMRTALDDLAVVQDVSRQRTPQVLSRGSDTVALGGEPYDFLAHRQARSAAETLPARSLAVKGGEQRRAASPCNHTASKAARKGSLPLAIRLAAIPASTSPLPATDSQLVAGGATANRPSGAAMNVSGPLAHTTIPLAWASASARALRLSAITAKLRHSASSSPSCGVAR